MYMFLAIIVGVSIVVAMVQNGALSERIGYKNTTLINFITGFLASALIFIFTGWHLKTFINLKSMGPVGYIGGALGVIVVLLSNIVIHKIPVIESAMLAYVGQLACGLVIDALMGINLSFGKIIGCVLIILGVIINSYIDRSKSKKLKIISQNS